MDIAITGSTGLIGEALRASLVADGHRRVRYRGIERNRQALTIRAATINLRRLLNLGLHWNNGWTLTT